jgi:hypothetical protein
MATLAAWESRSRMLWLLELAINTLTGARFYDTHNGEFVSFHHPNPYCNLVYTRLMYYCDRILGGDGLPFDLGSD